MLQLLTYLGDFFSKVLLLLPKLLFSTHLALTQLLLDYLFFLLCLLKLSPKQILPLAARKPDAFKFLLMESQTIRKMIFLLIQPFNLIR
jgi:hypothetical protein